MLCTKTQEGMLNALKHHVTMRFYGWSIYGNWYAAATRAELTRIGVITPVELTRAEGGQS